jgi:hypothetical protein
MVALPRDDVSPYLPATTLAACSRGKMPRSPRSPSGAKSKSPRRAQRSQFSPDSDAGEQAVRHAIGSRDIKGAQLLLNRLLQHDESSDAWALQMTICIATGDWVGTGRALANIERLDGPAFERTMLSAMVEDMQDHPSDARRLLLRAVEDRTLSVWQMSQAMEEADILEEDEILRTVVDRLLQLDPTHRAARRHRVRLLARADAYDEALTVIEPMTRDPEASFEDFDLLHLLLGRLEREEEGSSVDAIIQERWPTEVHKPLW